MKKITFIFALLIGAASMNAQETVQDSTKQGWTRGGNLALTFNQSAFNNEWTYGGVGNMTGNILINYDMNYVKGDYIWDNKLIADYGVNKNDGADKFTKNNDRLELNSVAGKKAKGFWFYSAYLNARTQMDRAEDGSTHFFSPAYFQFGPGILWKKSDNLNVNMSPAAAKLIVVHDEYTDVGDNQAAIDAFNEVTYFGVEANKTTRFELGASVRGYYKFNLMENISFENILGLYSNYLEDPQNVDVDYTANIVMSINKYISTNLTFQAIYDDNANRNGFQIREAFGLGFNYKF
ncbi:DUF3078 domain-containing protein [Aurantibacter sp.]|uniref:DUF3078 domain-containing protein n=1 Tax=Aurantibacter sp. TaxID=2807103 RepID=UPI0035C79FFE